MARQGLLDGATADAGLTFSAASSSDSPVSPIERIFSLSHRRARRRWSAAEREPTRRHVHANLARFPCFSLARVRQTMQH